MNSHPHASELCRRAEEAINEDDLDRARDLIADALARDEGYFPALLLRSQLALIEDNPVDALDDADEAHLAAWLALRGTNDGSFLYLVNAMRGYALLELGRFPEAALVLREALLLVERAKAEGTAAAAWADALGDLCAPDHARAEITVNLADALAFMGRADEAIGLLSGPTLEASGTESHVRLARLYERRGDFRTAAEHWRAAGPEYAPLADPRERAGLASHDLGLAHELRAQDLDAANFDPEEFDHGLEFPYSEIDPDTPEPVVTPAGRAIANAEAAAALDPADYHPLTLLSELCDFLRLPAQRLSYAERAAGLAASRLADPSAPDPDEAERLVVTLLGAVVAYSEVGRHEDALIYSQAAHRACREHLEAALIHASTLSALARHAEAEGALRTALVYHSEDPQLIGQLAEAVHQQGLAAEAHELLRRAEDLSHEPDHFQHVSVYYGRTGRWRDSVRAGYLSAVASGAVPQLRGGDYLAYAEECAARFEQAPADREARARLLAALMLAAYYAGSEWSPALHLAVLYPEGPHPDTPLIESANRALEARLLNPPRRDA